MKQFMRSGGRFVLCAISVFVAGFGVVSSTEGQVSTARPGLPEPRFGFELDLDFLLAGDDVFTERIDDPVWDLGGRSREEDTTYLQVRVLLEPGDEPAEVSSNVLSIRGAQFVAFRLVDPAESNRSRGRSKQVGPKWVECERCKGTGKIDKADALDDLAAKLGLGDGGETFDTSKTCPDCAGVGKIDANAVDAETETEEEKETFELPEDAPRLTRRFTLLPSGSVQWRMDRSIPRVETKNDEDNIYVLKINRTLLLEQNPGRPERITRRNGENSRAFAERRKQEQQEYQEKSAAYRELQKEVTTASEAFGIRGPVEVYAVYRLVAPNGQLNMTGQPPLPWTVSVAELEGLTMLANNRGSRGSSGRGNQSPFEPRRGEDQEDANNRIGKALQTIVASGHPYSLRMTAKAISKSELVSQALPGDGLQQTMKMIIDGEDDEARNLMLQRLALQLPPTTVSMTLLKHGADRMNPMTKLLSLNSAFPSSENDAADLAMAFDRTKLMLLDPQGPAPGMLIQLLSSKMGSLRDERQQAILTGPLPFGELKGDRRLACIREVVVAAAYDDLAAKWLDEQLLGGGDDELIDDTLNTMARLVVRPLPPDPKAAERTTKKDDDDDRIKVDPPAPVEAPADAIEVEMPIYIGSTGHAFFDLLASEDAKRSDLAWQALGALTFSTARAEQYGRVVQDQWSEADRERSSHREDGFDVELDLGRRSMRRFESSDSGRSSRGQEQTGPIDAYDALVKAAVASTPTRAAVMNCLLRDIAGADGRADSIEPVTRSLAALVAEADVVVSKWAAEVLRGSNLPLERAAKELTGAERFALIGKLYEHFEGKPLAVAGLVYTTDNRTNKPMDWFAEAFSAGRLPSELEWINAFGEERDLMRVLEAGVDEAVLAAAMILVKSAGGDDAAAMQFALQIAGIEQRSRRSIEPIWESARKKINAEALAKAAGTYELVFNLYGEAVPLPKLEEDEFGEPGGRPIGGAVGPVGFDDLKSTRKSYDRSGKIIPPAEDEKPTKVINFGSVQLKVEGETISFVRQPVNLAVASGRLGISIESPGDLKSLPNPDLAALPLERVDKPLVLVPVGDDGVWKGWVGLADRRLLEMVLKPISQ